MASRPCQDRKWSLGLTNSQPFGHPVVEKALSGHIGLHPFAINHKLWDGTFAGTLKDFICRAGRALDINFFVGNVVLGQKALGLAAIGAPGWRVNAQVHDSILHANQPWCVASLSLACHPEQAFLAR